MFPTNLGQAFASLEGARALILLEQLRVSESCGFGVPLLDYRADRPQLEAWAKAKGPQGLGQYREERNRASIDGLPGTTS